MKKAYLMLIVLAALLMFVTATAYADPPPNDHNCAGVVVTSVVGPGQPPMGREITSFYAHELQGVNDLFLQWASCP